MSKEKLKLDLSSKDWIRCQSKSHTGRFYMFNKATGETKWCSIDADAVAKKSEGSSNKSSDRKGSPPKALTAKLIKTPAQDRLKRLQNNLHKELKDLKEKNAKKERNKNNQNINSQKKNEANNKIKQALATEKMVMPYKAIEFATTSKTIAATPPNTSAETPKTTATATPLKATATTSPLKTTATTSPFNTTATATKLNPNIETKSLKEETPKLIYYGRRLRQCSGTVSLDISGVSKQSHDTPSAANESPDKSSAAKKSSDIAIAVESNDTQIVEKSNPAKSSQFEEDKMFAHLKRPLIRKSPKKSAKKRRLFSHKSVRFNPTKRANILLGNNATEDGSSDDAANKAGTSKSPVLRVGIIDKIKAICKNTFRMSSVPNTKMKSPVKVVAKSTNVGQTTSFASLQAACKVFSDSSERERNKNEHSAEITPSSAPSDKLMLLPAVRSINTPQPLLPPPPPLQPPSTAECRTPNNQVIPAYPRGSANSRLERLRQSLFLQPSSSAKTCITAASSSCANTTELCEIYNKNYYNNNNACEPMDWQSIEDFPTSNTVELVSIENRNKNPEVNYNHSSVNKADGGTISEYYDSVNANLLRFSAEKQDRIKWSTQKWLTDHYYFVIDTNVLLQNIAFIDDLIEMKLCDTNGTIIYIPYCVLQELDKLKMRSFNEGAKTLTVRAIKYLNKKFEERNRHIHAQSAIDERDHLIDVISADDSILNCCLHVKRHVENVVLLTEDVNLRNKAICNNLLVTTKSDLISKHSEPSTSASIWQEDARK